jgi:predicted O-linked N-acetylglucosamine transferase (SPINDLY family)
MMTVQQAFDLALQHHQAGRLVEAEALYRQILAVQPKQAGTLHMMGILANQTGRSELAVDLIRQALAMEPGNAAAYSNLGLINRSLGRLEEAVEAYRHASRLQPALPEPYNNLGNALREQGRFAEAIEALNHALRLQPGSAEIHANLGASLADSGRCEEALAAYQRALQIQPAFPMALYGLGNTLARVGRAAEAGEAFRSALEIQPGYVKAWNNLGTALREQGRLDEAASAFGRAISLEPRFAGAHNNLGNVLKDQAAHDEAIESFRHAVQLEPRHAGFHSNLIHTLHFHPKADEAAIVAEQRAWQGKFGRPSTTFAAELSSPPLPERRLRVGYVSADFRDHVIGRNLMPLFEVHDHQQFEIFAYSDVSREDEGTSRFRRHADHWRDTVGMPDEKLGELIHGDCIDILVDLAQHLAHNRLPVFVRQPAPVQVSFAGYPAGTGVEAIGHRISDRSLEQGAQPHGSGRCERVHLIDSFWCYAPSGDEPGVNALPASNSRRITFGCLNNFCKVNEPLLKLWARVLGAVPRSRILIMSSPGSHRQRTVDLLAGEGMEAERIEFVEPRPRREYLGLYQQLDIVLDTFPYNGHTTSLDALWMGVPVVSLAGQQPVSRAGLSQLSNLGLPELVAFNEEDYVKIATQLANDLPRLAELRSTLRRRMESSVLMDAPRFARQIEAAYRAMWREWCAKEAGK